ncbi:hypothetical protein PT974_02282 [Cladobotryum mycophilum]|uniref:AA1-like domain-containing protein n=1 Tax=Cladobotryum mycophilum TaxID=491253 RepID=A0ABR0SYV7_9HYPO
MQTSILSTIFLAASALALPTSSGYYPPPTTPTCTSKSTSISSWTVHDFDFHASYIFSTPAHQNSWGYANFTLENPALEEKHICSATSSQLSDFFYGTVVYECVSVTDGDKATFTYSRPDNVLRINQTWNCADEGSRFTAEGGIKLDLNCKEDKYQNPDWHTGDIYSSRTITCDKVTVTAPIETMTAVA